MVETAHAQWKIVKMGQKERLTAKIFLSRNRSILRNPFSVTYLRSEVELMHYYACADNDIIVMFETHDIGQTPSSFERYLVVFNIQYI